MNVIIDGRFVLDEADLHRRLAGAFGYGPLYRLDLQSLRERLADGDPRPLLLTWIHAESLRMALGTTTYDHFLKLFAEVEAADEDKAWNERFVFRLFD